MNLELQKRVCMHLEGRQNGAADLAREAGISPGTVSKIRNGIYRGTCERVAQNLAETIASREAAAAIASGTWKPAWIVRTRRSLRLVKRSATVERIKRSDPDAKIVQIWIGPELDQMHFVSE